MSRDKNRTPMQWSNGPNAGFSPADVETWLPVNPNHARGINVRDQEHNPNSLLNYYRLLLRVRRQVLGIFSKCLMLEVRKDGVRVVAICPGSVETGFGHDRTVPKISRSGLLQPEDVAASVLAAIRIPDHAL